MRLKRLEGIRDCLLIADTNNNVMIEKRHHNLDLCDLTYDIE